VYLSSRRLSKEEQDKVVWNGELSAPYSASWRQRRRIYWHCGVTHQSGTRAQSLKQNLL